MLFIFVQLFWRCYQSEKVIGASIYHDLYLPLSLSFFSNGQYRDRLRKRAERKQGRERERKEEQKDIEGGEDKTMDI